MEQNAAAQVPMPNLETLLVLDDEALVRVFLGKNLHSLGYTVLEGAMAPKGWRSAGANPSIWC